MDVGCRVVRGPDWQWGDQNSGEGRVGIVVQGSEETIEGTVWVQWDGGRLANYRAGFDGKMDLRVYDSSGKGVVHHHVMCDGCNQNPLMGMRWKCLNCHNYDLCTTCYMADTHTLTCDFTRIDEHRGKGTPVGKREGATKIPASGMFCGARVVRGRDWCWGEQDGGKGEQGTVIALREWKNKTRKNGVSVRWDRTKKDNIYRNGADGKVDLTVITPESGGFFYKDHLPGLVARSKKTVSGFTTGDKVQITVSKEELVKMAEGHGGWNENMEECISKCGVVHDFTKSGDVIVCYDGVKWRLSPSAIAKTRTYKVRDKVLVSSDKKLVMEKQEGHGGWNDNMKTMLGMIGTVKAIHEDEDVVISVENNIWLVNPAILTLHEAAKESDSDDEDIDLNNPLGSFFKQQSSIQKLLSKMLMSDNDSDDENENQEGKTLVQAAARGQLSNVKRILKADPELVNYKVMGKTGLHLACHNGNCDIIKLFLETPNCDTKITDSEGYVATHHAAYGDKSGEAIKVMLAHGEDPNIANNDNKSAPLHLAVKENNVNAVRVLVQSEKCDVNLQDVMGDTPLHDAILLRSNAIVDLILDAPRLNLTLKNAKGFNCLQMSAYKGNSHAARKLLSMSPELINVPKEDGYTCLHLAAVNDHCDIAEALLEHPDCIVDCLTKASQTPLILAVHEGYLNMVQILEQKGANVNAADDDGDTPLHMSLMREKFSSSGMGMMFSLIGNSPRSFIEISRYLVSHGADLRRMNKIGKTPMDFAVGSKLEEEFKEVFAKTRVQDEEEDQKVIKIVNEFGDSKSEGQTETDKGENKEDPSLLDNELVNNIIPEGESAKMSQNQSREFQNGDGNVTTVVKKKETDSQCLLCVDSAPEVVFGPCGHCILCKECAVRAKRCPQCKARVVTKKIKDGIVVSSEERTTTEQKLQDLEEKYQKLEESVTCCVCLSRRMNMVFSCGHGACQACTEKLTVCAICKKDIERKIAMF